jgi:putative AlgH/UPF0301 family transcriptional regulator
MQSRIQRFCLVLLGCVFAALGSVSVAQTVDTSQPVLLVAKPELGEFYRASVLLAVPARSGHHIGIIVNRPTQTTLARLFPEHAPSKLVGDPVFLGGPDHVNSIFAVVNRGESPGGHSIPLMDDLFLAVDVDIVDAIIEKEPTQARFFAGIVTWQPGELDSEVKRGFWYTLQPDVDLVLRKSPQGLWEELVRRSANML